MKKGISSIAGILTLTLFIPLSFVHAEDLVIGNTQPEILDISQLNIPTAPRLRSFAAAPAFTTAGTYATSSVPILHSLPNASVKFYLNFVGEGNPAWGGTATAFDLDNDTSTFTDAELFAIREMWARTAEKFAPFNVDITTEPLPSLVHSQNLEVLITNDYDWASGCGCGGMSYIGAFTNTGLPNVSYVFSRPLQNNSKYISEAIAHEVGHQLNLYHQSTYNGSGALVRTYSIGNTYMAPIMGSSYSSTRGLWWYGTSDQGSTVYQDDLAVISNLGTNGFGYRAQDHGQSTSTADQLLIVNNVASSTGIISKITDTDYFSFMTTGGTTTLNVNVAPYGPMLRAYQEIRNSNNVVVASSTASTTLSQSISTSLAAGTYYLVVKSDGTYGDVGQYSISGTVPQDVHTVFTVDAADANGSATSVSNNNYLVGSTVTLSAVPNSGYVFDFWSGDVPTTTQAITATSNPLILTADQDRHITAHFTPAYLLNINGSSNGDITISIPNTYANASTWYASGTPITLTASARSGYTFNSWSGDIASTSNPLIFTMDSAKTIGANFSSNVVVTSGGGGSGSSGGGGGGSSYSFTSATPQTVAVNPIVTTSPLSTGATTSAAALPTVDSGCINGNKFSVTTGKACSSSNVIVGQPFTPLYSLTQNLQIGSTGSEVMKLQQFLAGLKLFSGTPTTYYGSLTATAVRQFQAQYGIEQTGTIGPKTRQKIAELSSPVAGSQVKTSSQVSTISTGVSTNVTASSLTLNLQIGISGTQVLTLQTFLISKGLLSGPATGYYGSLTSAAVKAFQLQNGIQGTGTVGPQTRAKINSIGF